jgi:hypothetical protein
MQAMYTAQLVAEDPATYEDMLAIARRWAWRTTTAANATSDAGEADASGRHLSWSTVRVDADVIAWRMIVTNPPAPGGFRYQAGVSITRLRERAVMFVTVGRLADAQRLSPAPIGEFKRPNVVPETLRVVPCRAGSQPLTAGPRVVRASSVSDLITDLRDPERLLPVIVVSTADGDVSLPNQIADEACGLAHVVNLDGWLALDGLQARLPEARLPLRGARIYWPLFGTTDDRWHHRWWNQRAISETTPSFPSYVFQMLARLSTVALARDEAFEHVREQARAVERGEREARLASARAVGDLDAVVAELQAALANEQGYVIDLMEENERLEAEAASLRSYKDNFEALVADWPSDSDEPTTPAEPAELAGAASRDFSEMWDQLETQSDGAIVFTSRAKESWNDCPYPYPAKMREALTKLAAAASEWRAREGSLGMSLTSWLTQTVGLTYASSDEAMERLKIDKFEFDGRVLSRVPHIKLDDHVSPDRVGRIHFGIDDEQHRWVVDHVGVKMHAVAKP